VAAGRAAWPTALIRVIVVEAASVATAAFRFWLLFLGLSIPVRTSVPFVLPVAGALASAAGVFPSGLGLRELLVALLSPLVGLAPAAGFLASSAGRVCGTVALAPISLALAVRPGRGGGDGGELDLDGRESRNAGGGSP
jgi:hypothetical protein